MTDRSDEKIPEMTFSEAQEARSKVFRLVFADFLIIGPIVTVLLFFFF